MAASGKRGGSRIAFAEKGPLHSPELSSLRGWEAPQDYALYGRRGNRRFSMYVPERLVPEVRKAIRNGRRLHELINEAGIRYVAALKAEPKSKE